MLFPPDIGLGIQIASFLLLWWVLKRWLFDPTLRLLELRRERTTRNLAEAERLRSAVETMQADYAATLERARAAAREEIAEIRRDAESEEQRTLETARAEAAEIIEGVRTTLAQEVESARATVSRYAAELSETAAEKILGRSPR